ncbi:MAG: hypothetical protein GAK28_04945 [Luteibacter sp.]|uniref:hypothetical protein n=1 Tax=Luteibacter sp. TaxID=1886636 RepID=UPI001382C1B8|nr:hypothetical protein [Luteibacter sp.]KAF1003077.1 MAG: hypothetical protein GAK28_04945 [Luteibacter sp.]
MNNQYQLVLQWRGEAQPPFDDLIDLEETLIAGLNGVGDVDGHDMGQDESNIFVVTDTPEHCFQRCLLLLRSAHYEQGLAAAYRANDSETYIAIWPEGTINFHLT